MRRKSTRATTSRPPQDAVSISPPPPPKATARPPVVFEIDQHRELEHKRQIDLGGGRWRRNKIFNQYGIDLAENHIQAIGHDRVEDLRESIADEPEPPAADPIESIRGSIKESTTTKSKRKKQINFPMPKLFHYADISSINTKTPLSGGLGPSFIGTEQWNIAKSKLDAAKNFSVHVREQNQAKRSPVARLNRTLESSKKPD